MVHNSTSIIWLVIGQIVLFYCILLSPLNGIFVSTSQTIIEASSRPPAETTKRSLGEISTATTEAWCKQYTPTRVKVLQSQTITSTWNMTSLTIYNHCWCRIAINSMTIKTFNFGKHTITLLLIMTVFHFITLPGSKK